jgi:hypothetical protein
MPYIVLMHLETQISTSMNWPSCSYLPILLLQPKPMQISRKGRIRRERERFEGKWWDKLNLLQPHLQITAALHAQYLCCLEQIPHDWQNKLCILYFLQKDTWSNQISPGSLLVIPFHKNIENTPHGVDLNLYLEFQSPSLLQFTMICNPIPHIYTKQGTKETTNCFTL